MLGDLIDEEKEKSSYKILYPRVANYGYEQYLETTENSTVTIQPDLNFEVTEIDKKEVGNIINVIIQVISVGLKSFSRRLFCSNCNEDITSDEEFVICKKCDTMSLNIKLQNW